ncbi:hypothetical protein L484_008171 [Morus notabilis]|uniref:Uncharacterized protein n=1 Tax=Morus notabilis TaxID=981085 RepID=W9SHH9_9ROSA|nr:hypothetical protein L484_008171 [Morus notabilis]
MAVDNELQNQNMALLNPNRRVVRQGIPLRRRKLPSVRLGGKKPRRALARMFRRIRLRWLKLQYMCMMRKLKEFYRNLIKDMAGGGGGRPAFPPPARASKLSSKGFSWSRLSPFLSWVSPSLPILLCLDQIALVLLACKSLLCLFTLLYLYVA